MRRPKGLEVGTRVRVVPQHWLRGGEVGEIIGFEPRGRNNWLIQFECRCAGGGIDGDKLWLDQSEISALIDARASSSEPGDHRDDRSLPVESQSSVFQLERDP